jgi:N-acyl homoserine lactone hydrolase
VTQTEPRVTVEVDVIHFASLPTPHDYVFRPDGRPLSRWWTGLRAGDDALDGPCLAFILRHPERGVTLIDTGLHPDAHASVASDFGWPMRALFKGLRPVGPAFDEQLRDRGVDPDAIERVIMTHLHVDHTSGMRLLPNARFICTPEEWAATRRRDSALKGYVAHHLPDEHRVNLVDLTASGSPEGPFALTHDLFGDGSVRLVFTPGHTPGHLSVLVSTHDLGDVLLAGDAAYTLRSIQEERLPLLTDDDTRSRATLRQLRDYQAAHPAAVVVPTHDPEAWRRLHGKAAGGAP